MKGLLLRLSALDADAAAALRVIAHFEALLGAGRRLDAESLVRSTAGLAECPAGLEDALGPVALLADIPVDRLRAQPEVRALAGLAEGRGGPAALAALTAFLRTGSLRHAATDLHLHHSSVASRLSGVENALGYRLSDPQDRFRAQLALYALRLAEPET